MMPGRTRFHWADYLIFGASCLITLIVGLVFAVKEKWHKQSSESYLMAGRKMNWFLMGMSYIASLMHAGMFVALTTEFYYFGLQYVWAWASIPIGSTYVALVVVPKYFNLDFQITSAYEYFQYRYSLPVRMECGLLYSLGTLLYMGVMLYVPSLILSHVTGLQIEIAVAIGGIVCLLYTGFGGMKAVIWVDSIQILIALLGTTTLCIKGVLEAGGMNNIIDKYTNGRRMAALDVDPSPWNRHTVWNTCFLLGINMMGYSGTHQMVIQRYMTVPTLRRAQIAVVSGTVVVLVLASMMLIVGMSAFADVGTKEPLLNGQINQADEILSFYLMQVLGSMPGAAGLFVAALYAAALSSLSSGQNALAAVFLEDFVKPIYLMKNKRKIRENVAGWVSRITGLAMGLVTLGLSLTVPYFNKTILATVRSVEGLVSGPLLGVMLAAMFLPHTEAWGIFVGLLCSIVWGLWLFTSSIANSQMIGNDRPPLFNFSVEVTFPNPTAEPTIYDTSYTWYVFLDAMVVMLVATAISPVAHYIKASIRHERCSCSGIVPSPSLRYTWTDFLIAIGVKSWQPRVNKGSVDSTTQENLANINNISEINIVHVDGHDERMGYTNAVVYETNM